MVLLVIGGTLVSNPEASLKALQGALKATTHGLGWGFLWFALGSLIFLGWITFGRFGKIRLGARDSRPAYGTVSWIGMLFCAGLGSNLLYFGTMEWMLYYISPPPGLEARTPEAATWGGTYAMFHWGMSAWALYALAALPIGYALHVRRTSVLRLSSACEAVLGSQTDGPVGKAIDVLFIFGLVSGVGTSLGVGVPMVSGIAAHIFGLERGFALDVGTLFGLTAVFSVSVSMGLDKGIKRLSDLNVVLVLVFLAFVLLVGPTSFILNQTTENLGLLFQ
ncbi:MAG: BCCT family transporter, partial [Myxococcota bacterium]|nr:BCCT family transporter [Myxococcota bacterium]